MDTEIQYNAMNGLWILVIYCKYEESSRYIRIMIRIIVQKLFGKALSGHYRRVRSGRHYKINGLVVELHTDEWFPLIIASKNLELLERIESLFINMI